MNHPSRNESPATVRYAVFDLDRTITKHGTFTSFLLGSQSGRIAQIRVLLGFAPSMLRYRRGTVSRLMLKKHMLRGALRGMSAERIEEAAERFAQSVFRTGIRSAFRPVLERHRALGETLVLATASIDLYARHFASHFGFDRLVCTQTALTHAGACPLRILGCNCYGPEKKEAVMQSLLPNGRLRKEIFVTAYSDHHSDFPLLQWADNGVVITPRDTTNRLAKAANLKIEKW